MWSIAPAVLYVNDMYFPKGLVYSNYKNDRWVSNYSKGKPEVSGET